MINFDTEIIKYVIYFTDARKIARKKQCISIEQVDASCKQIKELGGAIQSIQQIRSVIIYD